MMRIVHVGLGPLGQKIVRFALERKNIEIVAAVDPDPEKAGRDLGELCGMKPMGIEVSPSLKKALRGKRADAAFLTTVSDVRGIESQIRELADARLHIVSTCEELSYPWKSAPRIARRIDRFCRRREVACLGTGVNPGFLMDFLPSVLSGVCRKVRSVKVARIQDASVRRIPFQRKIGAGLTRAEFARKQADGTLRHVGLTESMHLLAQALGKDIDRTTESLKPVIATGVIRAGDALIRPGMVRGVEQVGRAYVGRTNVITLLFRAAVGEPKSFDRIQISGDPNIDSTIAGGVHGDTATCAIVLNALASVIGAPPGLRTMLDIPAATCRG